MPLTEYNEVHRNLRNMQNYNLQEGNIIMQYYFDSEIEVPVESSKHGNAKSTIARDFRQTAHSVKQKIKETVQAEKNAAPQMLSEQVKESDALGDEPIADSIRSPKQISNYKQTHAPCASKDTDDITDMIMAIFQQAVGHKPDLLDKNLAFLQEVLIRHGKQMNVVTSESNCRRCCKVLLWTRSIF